MGGHIISLRGTGTQRVALYATRVPIGDGAGIDRRHAEIGGVEGARVDAQALGINLVIWCQNLRVTRPVEAHVENFVGRHAVGPGGTDQLHACRSDGVKCVGCEAAARCRGKRISAEWCGLGAVSEHVPARELHLVVHLMVDLDHKAVHRIRVGVVNNLLESAWS